LPDTLVIVLCIMALFIGLTWIIPAGEYQREMRTLEGGQRQEVVVPGTYAPAEPAPQGLEAFLTGPIRGFVGAAEILGFVFIVGGAFGILNRTGAITAGLQSTVQLSVKYPRYKKAIIPLIIILFSLAGATFGMSEEVLMFILILMPLSFALGYDSIVGVAIPIVATGAGFAGAFANPFTIGIAQGIAGLQPFSGSEYRMVVWACFTGASILYIMRYANKVERNPQASLMHDLDKDRPEAQGTEDMDFTPVRKAILGMFFLALAGLVYGVNEYGWYIAEISGLFFAVGLAAAAMGRLTPNETVDAFTHGAKDMMTAGLVIALSKGVLLIATEGKIIDTILWHIAALSEGTPKAISVQVMFAVQSFLNVFLPSGSGQAALTMPIMSPLSDILGVSRQTAVLAFQFGDGLSNMIIPTSGVTMGALAIAKIPYERWVRWAWPLMAIFFVMAMLLLVPPVMLFEWK
jgi:uncharacterized ion transporter superfamily protein YfcC